MAKEETPMVWTAPGATLALWRSPALGENVVAVSGGITVDAAERDVAICCEEYGYDGKRFFDIEIKDTTDPEGKNLWLMLSVAAMRQLIHEILLDLAPEGSAEEKEIQEVERLLLSYFQDTSGAPVEKGAPQG